MSGEPEAAHSAPSAASECTGRASAQTRVCPCNRRVRRTLKLQSRTTGTVGASTQPSKALGWGPQTGHTPKLTASQSMDLETATARKPFIRKRPDTPWKDNARRVRLRDAGWDAADEIARLSLH